MESTVCHSTPNNVVDSTRKRPPWGPTTFNDNVWSG